jgi:hypothetical protein
VSCRDERLYVLAGGATNGAGVTFSGRARIGPRRRRLRMPSVSGMTAGGPFLPVDWQHSKNKDSTYAGWKRS